MALIYSTGGETTRLEPSSFVNEAELQAYICRSPEAIPLDELGDGTRLHVLGREFPTPSGPIDALGTDQEGAAYIIETKLYKNPDKRLVLAQVLDYGAALWSKPPEFDDLLRALDADAARRQLPGVLPRLATFLGSGDDAAAEHLATVRENLKEGRFTAVVLMDRLEARLRNLIQFMNNSSRFRILAVELEYYRHGSAEIAVPRLFGAEARSGSSPGTGSRKWNEQRFFDDLGRRVTASQASAVRKFFDFAAGRAPLKWGSGAVSGSFGPLFIPDSTIAPISVYSNGMAELKLSWFGDDQASSSDRRMILEGLAGTPLPISDKGYGYWGAEVWTPHVDALIAAFAQLRAHPGRPDA